MAVRLERTLSRYLNALGDSPVASLIDTTDTVVARIAETVTETYSWVGTIPGSDISPVWQPEQYGRLAMVHLNWGTVDTSAAVHG